MTTYSYWRNAYSGQIFRMSADWKPPFNGWVPAHEANYLVQRQKYIAMKGDAHL